MTRPSFQFYPGDWQRNANLRRCSPAARGVWIDVMCLMHDSDEYGVLRWPLKEIAQAAGASLSLVRELVDKGVLKGNDKAVVEPFVYVPRSGRKDGDPVTLIDTQPGPIWYSSRMVKDEYVRTHAGASTRYGNTAKDTKPSIDARQGESPNTSLNRSPSRRHGEDQSDGSSTASSSATAVENLKQASPARAQSQKPAIEAPPDPPPLTLTEPPARDVIPVQRIVDAYHELLPSHPRVEIVTDTRRGYVQQRWRDMREKGEFSTAGEGVGWFRDFFAHVGRSPFLCGRVRPREGKRPFVAPFDWLMRPENFAKVVEGRYHAEVTA